MGAVFIKILICGSYGAFHLRVIQKLKKERHEIFTITGRNTKNARRVPDVFQEYRFDYTNDRIVNIIRSVKPDTVVFLGAQDSYYNWEEESRQSVEFISGLTNVIIASKMAGVSRFVYASSLSVFENNEENEIAEDLEPRPNSFRYKTVRQGEDLCSYYRDEGVFETIIIRFSEIYGYFNGEEVRDNICSTMLQDIVINEEVGICGKRVHLLLSVDDAAEVIKDIIQADVHKEIIYHAVGFYYTETEILTQIKKLMPAKQFKITESLAEYSSAKKIYHSVHAEELGFRARHRLEEELTKIYKNFKRYQFKQNQGEKVKKFMFGNIILPFIENILLFLLVQYLVTHIFSPSLNEMIDFYLLYVVIIAAVYGTMHTLIAVVLSAAGSFAEVIQRQGIAVLVSDYSNYLWVLQILIVGVLAGYVRDKYVRKGQDLKDENDYYQEELQNIKKINEGNVYIKNVYEERLVNSKNSLAKVYEITSQLDFLEPRKVVFQAIFVIKQIMQAKDVAIYTASAHSKYLRLSSSSSKEAAQMGKSLCFDENSPFYEDLSQKNIFRNQKMEDSFPTFCGAAYGEDELIAIIMVWSDRLEQATLYEANLLAVLCRLLEKSMSRSYAYSESIYNSSYIEDSRIMKKAAFREMLDTYRNGYEQGLLEYVLFEVDTHDMTKASLPVMEKLVRDTDIIGYAGEGRIFLLLPNSTKKDAVFVQDRFEKKQLHVKVIECKERGE